MVIGNGLVAKAFEAYKNDDRYLVFASGVSNSANTDLQAFEREKKLLASTLLDNSKKRFIYFSSCSLYDESLKESLYVKHKLEMEAMIKDWHNDYHIFRVSNLAGKTDNPNTLLNFFYYHILNGSLFTVWKNATRNIIDIDDATVLSKHIIEERFFVNEITNIANPHNYKVTSIIEMIESMLAKKGNYNIVDKSSAPVIDTSAIKPLISNLNIEFNDDYLQKVLSKYY